MAELLFLAHRIPYPPDKGDKIRSWNILRHLADRHVVHLGCFIDDPGDHRHVEALEGRLGETHFSTVPRSPLQARNIAAFWHGRPITIQHYRCPGMASWVAGILQRRPLDGIFVYSSAMAQYVLAPAEAGPRRVIDFVDVDSDKWGQYARRKPWPISAIYHRESRLLADYERRIAGAFDSSVFVSQGEAALFRQLAPESCGKVSAISNGIDAEFFSADRSCPSPFDAEERALVFTGAMDYWANIDAVQWFAREIHPRIRDKHPAASFWIVGSNPARQVAKLTDIAGVMVTGKVADIRPFLAHAAVVVAPLRIARGLQNKVLEGMAMGRPVVTTSAAASGIDAAVPGTDFLTADTAEGFVAALSGIIADDDRAKQLGRRARARIMTSYCWSGRLRALDDILGLHQSREPAARQRIATE